MKHHIALVQAKRQRNIFEWRGPAVSIVDAAAKARAAYQGVLRATLAAHGLDGSEFKGAFDVIDVIVSQARVPSGWRLSSVLPTACAIMSPNEIDPDDVDPNLAGLLREVIYADPGCVDLLAAGREVGVVLSVGRLPSRQGYAIEAETVQTDEGHHRRHRLRHPDLRQALKLLAIHAKIAGRKWGGMLSGSYFACDYVEQVTSATLRAAIKANGVRAPLRLLTWLDAHGHTMLAASLAKTFKAPPPAAAAVQASALS